MSGVETRKSLEQPAKVDGDGALKSNLRSCAPRDFRLSQRGSEVLEEVQRMSLEGEIRLCSMTEARTAEPSLPVMEVRAIILRDGVRR